MFKSILLYNCTASEVKFSTAIWTTVKYRIIKAIVLLVTDLARDVFNTYHILGQRSNCNAYFCYKN